MCHQKIQVAVGFFSMMREIFSRIGMDACTLCDEM